MKKLATAVYLLFFASILANAQTQVTKQLLLSNGDGWYRVVKQNLHAANGMIRIWGTGGNNKSTGLTLFVSMMAYGQGGSLNIVDNTYYNNNHVAEIRAGSSSSYYVVDIKFENINNPTTVTIQTDGRNLQALDAALFGDLDEPAGLVSISGKVLGTTSTRWPIYLSQRVGIGTTTIPSGFNFAVDGKAIMEEVKVQVSEQWPDYVFDDTYPLMSLQDIKKFISQNRRLPEIPSAADVETEGLELGQINVLLLKKIEELTLHLIKQEEEMLKLKLKLEQMNYRQN